MARTLKDKECYYCRKPAISREHAPPAQLFRDLNMPQFTTPSCKEHNTDKSGADDTIIKAMLMGLDTPTLRITLPIPVLEPVLK